jgi:ABC-type glycerol-3-phosphate transport system substrate-binding protein
MKKMKMIMPLSMSVLLAATVLSGCSQQDQPTATATATASSQAKEQKASEPVPIRWVRAANEQDPQKDRILLELQKRTNTKIEIVSIPSDQFANKLNLMMASGESFDLATVDSGKTLNEWAKNDLIVPYDEYLKSGKYPNINAIVNSEVYKGFKIDGKSYFKPLGLAPMQWGWIIRTDWLENVGLSMPTTLEEFYNVAKAFKEKDPDKNGKNDTYGVYTRASGMSDPSITQLAQFISKSFAIAGRTDNWVAQKDGSITRYEISPQAKDAAAFYKKLLKEDLINKDWLSLKPDGAQGPESDDFGAGKYGMTATTKPDLFLEKAKTVNPNAKIAYLPPLKGTDGVPANLGHSGGYWRGNVIPKTSKHPEKAMELMEYTLTQEGRELTEFGIKGIHFTDVKEVNGSRVYTLNKAEADKDWDTKKNGYLYPLAWGAMNYFEYAYIPIKEKNYNYDEAFKNLQPWITSEMAEGKFPDWFATNAKYAMAPPLMNVFDDKMLGDQTKLRSTFGEGWLKAIMGDNFDAAWDELQKKWLAAGGQDVITYGQEYYKINK